MYPKSEYFSERILKLNFGGEEIKIYKKHENFERLPSKLKRFIMKNFISYSSNILLHGVKGIGKSGTLYACSMYAKSKGWIVFNFASAI